MTLNPGPTDRGWTRTGRRDYSRPTGRTVGGGKEQPTSHTETHVGLLSLLQSGVSPERHIRELPKRLGGTRSLRQDQGKGWVGRTGTPCGRRAVFGFYDCLSDRRRRPTGSFTGGTSPQNETHTSPVVSRTSPSDVRPSVRLDRSDSTVGLALRPVLQGPVDPEWTAPPLTFTQRGSPTSSSRPRLQAPLSTLLSVFNRP